MVESTTTYTFQVRTSSGIFYLISGVNGIAKVPLIFFFRYCAGQRFIAALSHVDSLQNRAA